MAAALIVACCLCLYLAFTARGGWLAVLGFATAAIDAVAVVATGSRTGAVALVAGVCIATFTTMDGPKVKLFFRLLLVLAMGFTAYRMVPPQYIPERIFKTFDAVASDDLSGRQFLWDAALDRGLHLAGTGYASSETYFLYAIGDAHVTHNVYLEVMLELGLIGAILFGLLAVISVRATRKSLFFRPLIAIWTTMAIMSTTLSLEWRRIFWLTIALTLCTASKASQSYSISRMRK